MYSKLIQNSNNNRQFFKLNTKFIIKKILYNVKFKIGKSTIMFVIKIKKFIRLNV